jgi:molybdenum cofactor cytidylyltransferase
VTELSAIVLAAGHSSRMGELKPLLSLGGRTLLERAVAVFTSVGIDDVVVVTGHRGDEVAAVAGALGARPVANPRYDDGMYTSVQTGAAAVAEDRRFFLLPVDCPLVRPETAGRVARAGAAAGAEVALPAHAGRTGHPPLLAPVLRAAILAAEPAGGLRELLAGRPQLRVEVDDPGVLHDVDTRADFEALRAAAAAEDLPSERRCLELLREGRGDEARVAHCAAVASVAAALTAALNERHQCLCAPLVVAAALLHDVARDEPRHAEAGADLLQRLGYARLAPLVRGHMRLGAPLADQLDEAQIVYLADKLVLGDRVVTLDERFGARLQQVAADPDAWEGVLARLAEARGVQARVEQALGRPLDPESLG